MGFSTPDIIIVLVYLVGIAILGVLAGGKQASTHDYFLGGKRIPWWAVCFAIVATETSTLTFISIPGVAYVSNLNFLQLTFGYILGRIAIAALFLPAYCKGEMATVYTYLSSRFGPATRNTASSVFMVTRLFADGVRLYATAIPIKLVTGVDYPAAIAITAAVTLLYTYIGGVRSVIWMDVVQMFIYLGGAVAAIAVLQSQLPDGLAGALGTAGVREKLTVVRTGLDLDVRGFFTTPYTAVASIVGGAFLSMASHGTDQLIVQRVLTTPSLRDGQRAMVVSGFIVMAQFAVFLTIGVLLYVFYNGAAMDPNEVFPQYIIEHLPSGVSGLIVAGLLAAAMSTLAGSMNALASATMFDLYKPYFGAATSATRDLFVSRVFTFAWCILIVSAALFFMNTTKTVVELALTIASFTYGGLLGAFLSGVLFPRIHERDVLFGFGAGILVMIYVVAFTPIAWTWYTIIGSSVTTLVAVGISSRPRSSERERIR